MRSRQRTAIASVTLAAFLMLLVTGCETQMQSASRGEGARVRVDAEPDASQGNRIRLEHVALNVAEPVKMARWYVDNLGMRITREGPAPANMRFLADTDGNMMLELYRNPPEIVPDYASMDPLLLHVAFLVDDVDAIREKLLAAGATSAGDVEVTPAGDKIAMLRDPWGLAIQFVHRADPMLTHDRTR